MSWCNFQMPLDVPCLAPLAGRGRIASAIRVRGSLREGSGNCFKHTSHVAQYLVVPKSQNAIVVSDEPSISNCITGTVRMLPSINFNDETALPANKIHRIRADRLLPDELMSIQPSPPQPEPEGIFSIGSNLPQSSGASCLGLISRAHAETPPHPDCCAIRPRPASGER